MVRLNGWLWRYLELSRITRFLAEFPRIWREGSCQRVAPLLAKGLLKTPSQERGDRSLTAVCAFFAHFFECRGIGEGLTQIIMNRIEFINKRVLSFFYEKRARIPWGTHENNQWTNPAGQAVVWLWPSAVCKLLRSSRVLMSATKYFCLQTQYFSQNGKCEIL